MNVIEKVLEDKKLEDLQKPKFEKGSEPELTEEKVEEAVVLLKNVEENNGHLAIAQELGLTNAQVAKIHKAMADKISELLQ